MWNYVFLLGCRVFYCWIFDQQDSGNCPLFMDGIFWWSKYPVNVFWELLLIFFHYISWIIMPTEGGILESASVTNFSIRTIIFIYLDLFLRVDDEFVSVRLSVCPQTLKRYSSVSFEWNFNFLQRMYYVVQRSDEDFFPEFQNIENYGNLVFNFEV